MPVYIELCVTSREDDKKYIVKIRQFEFYTYTILTPQLVAIAIGLIIIIVLKLLTLFFSYYIFDSALVLVKLNSTKVTITNLSFFLMLGTNIGNAACTVRH